MEMNDFNQSAFYSCTNVAIACNTSGVVYALASKNTASGYRAEVSKYNGITWQPVGTSSISIGTANYNNIAMDPSGVPYIAFSDAGIGNRASAYKFNGTSWVAVGSSSISAGQANSISFALDTAGTPYIAYSDVTNSNKLAVKKFDGTNWVYVGTPSVSAGTCTFVSMVIDSSGNPIVAYADGTNSNKITVMSFNGISWSTIGLAAFSAPNANYISLKLDNTGMPHVGFSDNAAGGKTSVMKYNGSGWVYVGSAGFSSAVARCTSMDIGPTGSIYISFFEQLPSGLYQLRLMTYNGISWIGLGNSVYCYVTVLSSEMVFDGTNGIPYITYLDAFHDNLPIVRKYVGAGLDIVGDKGFSDFDSNYPGSNLSVDNSGAAYLCSVEPCQAPNSYKVRVSKFNGSSWNQVGLTIDSGDVAFASLDVNKLSGIPYVAYRSGSFIKTFMYNGSSWVSTGSLNIYFNTTNIIIKVDPNGIPFIIYRDNSQNKIYAYKYINNIWTSLGVVDVSNSSNPYHHGIAFSLSGTPYVSYPGSSYPNPMVKMYNGTSWVSVGITTSLPNYAEYVSIAVTPAGEPIIVYGAMGSQAKVFKYNGANWIQVGALNSYLNGGYGKIEVDDSGTPFVYYSENGSYKANVVRYNGANWINVGMPDFSSGPGLYGSMALDQNGGIYVSYSYGYLWTKMYKSYISITSDPSSISACPNSTVIFSASATGSITNIQWQKSSGTQYVNLSNSGIYNGVNTNTLTVSGINASINGHKFRCVYTDTCGSKHTAFATLTCYGNTIAIQASNMTLCVGQSATLSAIGANTYTWNTSAMGNSIVVNPTVTTSYSVSSTTVDNCQNSTSQLIAVNPLPTVNISTNDSVICVNQTTTLTATGAVSYTWMSNNVGNQEIITPTITTNYTVVGSNANGCLDTALFTQLVDPCTGFKENAILRSSFTVYPNPSHNEFYFESDVDLDVTLVLYDAIGEKVLETKVVKGRNKINTLNLARGLYYSVFVLNNKFTPLGKLVIE